jgi:hypothetical protein
MKIELLLPSVDDNVHGVILSEDFELTPTEKRVYELVCQGDVMCKQIPPSISGAVPGLVRKGLVEIYVKDVSSVRSKKMKFLRKVI